MIGRQSGVHRPNDGRYPASGCRRFCDKMSSTDRLAIVSRLTPDDRATVGRYHDEKIFKMSADVGRSSGDHRPTLHRWQNPWKSADRSTKLLTWVLRQKSRRPTKKFAKIGADVGRQSADVARFSNFWLTDRRATVGLGNVTVVLLVLRRYSKMNTVTYLLK